MVGLYRVSTRPVKRQCLNVLVASRTSLWRGREFSKGAVKIADLPKGEHFFQCCIHPWMRVKVEVK